jgi:hypothetical protein
MKRVLLVGSCAAVLLAMTAASASAVLPKKNGVYVGDIKSSPVGMRG